MNHDYGSIYMKILTVAHRGRNLGTYEKFYINKYRKMKQVLNKEKPIGYSPSQNRMTIKILIYRNAGNPISEGN
jgi:hypothetical protein